MSPRSTASLRIAILTVSDRSAAGQRVDESGPLLERLILAEGWQVTDKTVVADDPAEIQARLAGWADSGLIDVILTTGGTGFSPRDVTPEATKAVIERDAPGLAEAMRAASLRMTAHAMLSRAVAGIRQRTLIINLPGSPKGAVENLQVILPILGHAVDLLSEAPQAEAGHTGQAEEDESTNLG